MKFVDPKHIGPKYDKIAHWWHEQHSESSYGIEQIRRAIRYCQHQGSALDVGCGSGGRIFRVLEESGFQITGIDASPEMIAIATANHPVVTLQVADIREWQSDERYDLIIAWDSIFHLAQNEHDQVLKKLANLLAEGGILVYTLGDAVGEHESDWHDEKFPYSSIGIGENLRVLMDCGLQIRHVELDQYPQKHTYIIARKGE